MSRKESRRLGEVGRLPGGPGGVRRDGRGREGSGVLSGGPGGLGGPPVGPGGVGGPVRGIEWGWEGGGGWKSLLDS